MRRLLLSALFCLLVSITAQADSFVILPNGEVAFNTSFTTQATFTCSLCTGSGTNSVVFGSGGNTLTLTFAGVNTTMVVGGTAVPALVGQIQVVASGSGFVFPASTLPLVTLNFAVTQTSPTAGGRTRPFISGFGGDTSLSFVPQFSDHVSLPTGPSPSSFTFIVYTFSNFTIPNTTGVVDINAQLVAVPEPTSLLLLGSGLGMGLGLLRKRFAKHQC